MTIDRRKRTTEKSWVLAIVAGLLGAFFPAGARAVDGFSVTTHWSGINDEQFGGFGEIRRHDIKDDVVVSRVTLYADSDLPARNPVLSPDGSHVAFLLVDGSIAVMPTAGGEVAVLDNARTHGEAHMDWPSSDWIYYLKGGYNQPSGADGIHRVSPWSGVDELVWETTRDDGRTPSGNWRIHVARDLVRAVIRPDQRIPEPYGRIVAFNLEDDAGVLRLDRSTDRFSCSTGIDPFGEFFADGQQDHKGVDIRRWDDLTVVDSVRWEDTLLWGPDTRPTGFAHNRNSWSANSSDWICVHIGWGKWGSSGANQMLIDWKNRRRIVVTENTANSFSFDSSGDFFVGLSSPPEDTKPPLVQRVWAEPEMVWVRWSEKVEPQVATDLGGYGIEPATKIFDAALSEDGRTVALVVDTLEEDQDYQLYISGGGDLSGSSYRASTSQAFPFSVSKPIENLEVDAGADVTVPASLDLYVSGTVTSPSTIPGNVEYLWEQVDGPAQAELLRGNTLETYASFSAEGDYRLRLTARAGGSEASDDLLVHVSSEPSITIASPVGGEVFEAEEEVEIQWTTSDVSDVRIDFSADDGETWQAVDLSIDVTSEDWGSYRWRVPSVSTEYGRLRLEEYSQVTSAVSESFTVQAGEPKLALEAPKSETELTAGQEVVVRFEASGLYAVRLEYSLDGGASWEPIATVGSMSERFGNVTWKVPDVWTKMAVVRAAALDGCAEDKATGISIAGGGDPGPVDAVTIRLDGHIGPVDAVTAAVKLGEAEGTVGGDGSFTVEAQLPVGVKAAVFELVVEDGHKSLSRVVRLDLEDVGPTIEGTEVSRGELVRFLGGREGVLVFIDGDGNVQKLDFTEDAPHIVPVLEAGDCVNPIVSPDGTRIIYGWGKANNAKEIRVQSLTEKEANQMVGVGDVGYWFVDDEQNEYAVIPDWSAKDQNGADGTTKVRKVQRGGIIPDGPRIVVHDRAMDAGVNKTGRWLGQVYANLRAYDLVTGRSYPTERFFLMEGKVADHQTCNGSMAPDETARLMTLVIPHDYVRIFSYEELGDRFVESSRFQLPPGFTEWEFPEWSTDPEFFTAILRTADLKNHLAIVKVEEGNIVPEVLLVGIEDPGGTFSHLWVAASTER